MIQTSFKLAVTGSSDCEMKFVQIVLQGFGVEALVLQGSKLFRFLKQSLDAGRASRIGRRSSHHEQVNPDPCPRLSRADHSIAVAAVISASDRSCQGRKDRKVWIELDRIDIDSAESWSMSCIHDGVCEFILGNAFHDLRSYLQITIWQRMHLLWPINEDRY